MRVSQDWCIYVCECVPPSLPVFVPVGPPMTIAPIEHNQRLSPTCLGRGRPVRDTKGYRRTLHDSLVCSIDADSSFTCQLRDRHSFKRFILYYIVRDCVIIWMKRRWVLLLFFFFRQCYVYLEFQRNPKVNNKI